MLSKLRSNKGTKSGGSDWLRCVSYSGMVGWECYLPVLLFINAHNEPASYYAHTVDILLNLNL